VTSTSQAIFYEDFRKFQKGGWYLLDLAFILWISTSFAEVLDVYRYMVATFSLRGKSTRLGLTEEKDGIIMKEFSDRRLASIFVFVIVPRLGICLALCYLGCRFLIVTRLLQDVLLNAVCLAFVLNVDELIFESLVPGSIKLTIECIEPIQTKQDLSSKSFSRYADFLFKLIFLSAALVYLNAEILLPIFSMLSQACNILCSGDLDFVYTLSPATGIAYAAKSYAYSSDVTWTSEELAVLEVAQAKLDKDYFSDDVMTASMVTAVESAILVPTTLPSLGGASPDNTNFDHLLTWSASKIEDVVAAVACQDKVSDSEYSVSKAKALAKIVGGVATEMNCGEVGDYCKYMNMSGVRTICPKTCGCFYPQPNKSGFFQTAPWGCPSPCSVMWPFFTDFECGDVLMTVIDRDTWAGYVSGLKTYFLSRDGVEARVNATLYNYYEWYGVNESQVTTMVDYIIGGDFFGNISNFSFFFGPNMPHPNGKEGCSFLTSDEVVFLLNLDFCSTGNDFLSLRMVCAESCKCADLPINCPASCLD